MNNNRLLLTVLVVTMAGLGARLIVAQQKSAVNSQRRTRTAVQTQTSRQGVRMVSGSAQPAGIPVPAVGTSYTVQALLDLINTNNPNDTSNFIVPINASGAVMMNQDCSGDGIKNIAGSKSVGGAGLSGIIQANLTTNVTLNADPMLIAHLGSTGVLNTVTSPQYTKILLYFTLAGYRFYINDPYPPKIILPSAIAGSGVNPAAQIISRWAVQ